MNGRKDFFTGLRNGIPICLAYIAVSFSFGLVATKGGLPTWLATVISATNLTSAGQFAGINMMFLSAGLFEIALAVLVINSRYMLMGFSLSQQLDEKVGTVKRLVMSLFITDEIFALASMRGEKLSFSYFIGLSVTPYFGWVIGTLLGGLVNGILPPSLQAAAGIALYCMFIAIIVPPAKKDKKILLCILLSAGLSCALYYIPYINKISFGFRVIIASVLSAIICALIFPAKEEDSEEVKE